MHRICRLALPVVQQNPQLLLSGMVLTFLVGVTHISVWMGLKGHEILSIFVVSSLWYVTSSMHYVVCRGVQFVWSSRTVVQPSIAYRDVYNFLNVLQNTLISSPQQLSRGQIAFSMPDHTPQTRSNPQVYWFFTPKPLTLTVYCKW